MATCYLCALYIPIECVNPERTTKVWCSPFCKRCYYDLMNRKYSRTRRNVLEQVQAQGSLTSGSTSAKFLRLGIIYSAYGSYHLSDFGEELLEHYQSS